MFKKEMFQLTSNTKTLEPSPILSSMQNLDNIMQAYQNRTKHKFEKQGSNENMLINKIPSSVHYLIREVDRLKQIKLIIKE